MNPDDYEPRIIIGQTGQAWSDIRSYTANIWQVSALCLTAIVLGINIIVASLNPNSNVPTEALPILIFFILLFSCLASYTISWLRNHIVLRVEYIQQAESQLLKITKPEYIVVTQKVFSIGDGPLVVLHGLFICMATVSMFFLIGTLTLLILPLSVALLLGIPLAIGTGIILSSNYLSNVRREQDAKISGEIVQVEQSVSSKDILLFLVEGLRDKLVIKSLLSYIENIHRKKWRAYPHYLIFAIAQRQKMKVKSLVQVVMNTENSAVVIIRDRDKSSKDEILSIKTRMLDEFDIDTNRVYFSFPNPEVEAWLQPRARIFRENLEKYLSTYNWEDAINQFKELSDLVDHIVKWSKSVQEG